MSVSSALCRCAAAISPALPAALAPPFRRPRRPRSAQAGRGPAIPGSGRRPGLARRPAARRRLALPLLLAGGLLYAAVAGSFSRYSWPVTVAVVGPGTLAVAIGWQGPPRPRPVRAGVAARRAAWWAVPLVTGGLWELTALAGQPSLTTDSPAHPTISTLTDPLLASHLGRSLFLASWLILGGWLIER